MVKLNDQIVLGYVIVIVTVNGDVVVDFVPNVLAAICYDFDDVLWHVPVLWHVVFVVLSQTKKNYSERYFSIDSLETKILMHLNC